MVDIMAIGAHPDDCEFACGGILSKMADQGKSIAIVDLCLGEKGSNGTSDKRKKEGLLAAEVIGADRLFLDFNDCEIVDTYANRLKLVKVIRQLRPKLILAPLWKGEMNHPDHIACGMMARYACRYSRFKKILPEILPHRPSGILHYLFPVHENPDFLIDVSEYVDIWKEMMEKHASQMKTNDYPDWNLRAASKFGVMIGKKYAQGLIKGNPIEIDDLTFIEKGTLEI